MEKSHKNTHNPADSDQLATVKLWSTLLAHELSVAQDGPSTHIISLHRPSNRSAVTINRKVCPTYAQALTYPYVRCSSGVDVCGICGKFSLTYKKKTDNET